VLKARNSSQTLIISPLIKEDSVSPEGISIPAAASPAETQYGRGRLSILPILRLHKPNVAAFPRSSPHFHITVSGSARSSPRIQYFRATSETSSTVVSSRPVCLRGRLKPDSFSQTAARRASISIGGWGKLNSVLIFRHISLLLNPIGPNLYTSPSGSFNTVFHWCPGPRVPSFFFQSLLVSLERPIPSG